MDAIAILELIAILLPKIIELIILVEKLFESDPKSGSKKKELVMAAAERLVPERDAWIIIAPFIDDFIEKAVQVSFKASKQI
jgi:hypothetical protein